MTVKISKKYQPLWNPKTRYILITGGRGSQKSFAVSTWACIQITDQVKPWIILYTRYTMQSAEISVIPEFSEKIEILNKNDRVSITKTLVECKRTGSKIIFSGIKTQSGNQTARLKSIPGLNVFIVDEAEEFRNEADFNTIDDSIRMQGVPNLVIIIMNPQDTEHWIWKRWFENSHRMQIIDGLQVPISTHPDITHIHTTWIDNKENLSADFIQKIKNLKASNLISYGHRYIGQWLLRKEGAIFNNWKEGEFDTSLPFAYGLDYGYWPDPLALVKVAVDESKKLIYVHEEIYETNLSHTAVLEAITRQVEKDKLIVCDTSEPRTSNSLAEMGINIQKADKFPNSIETGIKKMLDYQIIVTEKSYNIKFELANYLWNDKKSSTPIDKYNHALDAARYAFMRLTAGNDYIASSKFKR